MSKFVDQVSFLNVNILFYSGNVIAVDSIIKHVPNNLTVTVFAQILTSLRCQPLYQQSKMAHFM